MAYLQYIWCHLIPSVSFVSWSGSGWSCVGLASRCNLIKFVGAICELIRDCAVDSELFFVQNEVPIMVNRQRILVCSLWQFMLLAFATVQIVPLAFASPHGKLACFASLSGLLILVLALFFNLTFSYASCSLFILLNFKCYTHSNLIWATLILTLTKYKNLEGHKSLGNWDFVMKDIP